MCILVFKRKRKKYQYLLEIMDLQNFDLRDMMEMQRKSDEEKKLQQQLESPDISPQDRIFLEKELARARADSRAIRQKLEKKGVESRRFLTTSDPRIKIRLPYTQRSALMERYPDRTGGWEDPNEDHEVLVNLLDLEDWAQKATAGQVRTRTYLLVVGLAGALAAGLAISAYSSLQKQVSQLTERVKRVDRDRQVRGQIA